MRQERRSDKKAKARENYSRADRMRKKMEVKESGEGLFAITDDLLYVREKRSRDVIPVSWDDLAGGIVYLWGSDGQASLVKKSGCENKDLSSFMTPIGPCPQFHHLLMHLDMEKGWIRDFWIEGDHPAHQFASIIFLNPGNKNDEEVWGFFRKYDLLPYFMNERGGLWPLALIKDDFVRILVSRVLKEKEEKDGRQ